jgi:hypothetical protein
MTSEKAHENKLRRMAERQGFFLQKSRIRDPYANGYKKWWIVDPETDISATAEEGISLDEAEAWLKTDKGSR